MMLHKRRQIFWRRSRGKESRGVGHKFEDRPIREKPRPGDENHPRARVPVACKISHRKGTPFLQIKAQDNDLSVMKLQVFNSILLRPRNTDTGTLTFQMRRPDTGQVRIVLHDQHIGRHESHLTGKS